MSIGLEKPISTNRDYLVQLMAKRYPLEEPLHGFRAALTVQQRTRSNESPDAPSDYDFLSVNIVLPSGDVKRVHVRPFHYNRVFAVQPKKIQGKIRTVLEE